MQKMEALKISLILLTLFNCSVFCSIDFQNVDILDPMKSRYAPNYEPSNFETSNFEPSSRQSAAAYQINPSRLAQIREELLYPFFDRGGKRDTGDFQMHIRDNSPQITKHLNFLLPFFGFGYNYTWVSLHGHLAFSDGPTLSPTYPLEFPIVDYPKESDPSFIGPFYSKCKIGELNGDELDNRTAGVYYRLEQNLMTRTDQLGVELRERLKWDIREGMIGAEWFEPRHAVIVTWKNVTFAGGTIHARKTTNTFQLVLATDETRTYAMINYKHLGWLTHTEAGGSSEDGTGGTPAFIGFNAGNATRAYEYKPYSQTTKLPNIMSSGNVNRMPGRHIFRIDEKILSGQCIPEIYDMSAHLQQLTFAPESGNMLGGTIVNITGPCYKPDDKITCRFNTITVQGSVINENRATCVAPAIYATGYIEIAVEVQGSNDLHWKGKFLIESPLTAVESIIFLESDVFETDPQKLTIQWDYKNLTLDQNAPVSISLWGYREKTINPEFIYIDTIIETSNSGEITLSPRDFANRNTPHAIDLTVGLLTVNISNPSSVLGVAYAPVLWSRPKPLGWFLKPQWERKWGTTWSEKMCEDWIVSDRLLKNFASDLPICPCLLSQAIHDKGRFLPDSNCDGDGKVNTCDLHYWSAHCVKSAMPSPTGAGQQCCYDIFGNLMMTHDQKWGGRPGRSHDYGQIPWNEASKVPSLSHYLHDVSPYYPCCMWEEDQSWWCMTMRLERRVSSNCVGYQVPGVATIYGDPHIHTFDGLPYTFNGKGEYVLVKANTDRHKLDIQARFEQLPDNMYGRPVDATIVTAVAARDNQSATVEIRLRPRDAQWRYKLDVIVDQHRIFFDRYPQKIQYFPGVTVYTPTAILNQSHVVAMFESGAGVEVIENKGHLTARVYLPWTYLNQTRGLFGNWSGLIEDDLVLPDGSQGPQGSINNLDALHYQFGMLWAVDDKDTEYKGVSLFYHENGKTSSHYFDRNFKPVFYTDPQQIIPYNVSLKPADVEDFCGDSYQCKYDYSVTLNREYAHWTKWFQNQFIQVRDNYLSPVTSCGALMTPVHGRKSTFKYTPGTEVRFDCDPNYVLVGERKRVCEVTGEWNIPRTGDDMRTETEWLNWYPVKASRCIEEGEYEAVASAKTAGIVLAVLFPIICIVFGILFYYKKGKDERKEAENRLKEERKLPFKFTPIEKQISGPQDPSKEQFKADNMTIVQKANEKVGDQFNSPKSRKTLSSSPATINSTNTTDNSPPESETSTYADSSPNMGKKDPSKYKGVYYTREPLPNRPKIKNFNDETPVDPDELPQSPPPPPPTQPLIRAEAPFVSNTVSV